MAGAANGSDTTAKTTRSLPGDPTPREYVERVIRVDHAGELGAQWIYEGQRRVLGKTKYGPLLEEMQDQEIEHLTYFEEQIAERRVRPTVFHPLWTMAGFALGAGTALIGPRAAMACTVAVETAIDEHYQKQLETLGEDEASLKAKIQKFKDDEEHHKDIGLENEAELAPAYRALTSVIHRGCKLAIWLSERA